MSALQILQEGHSRIPIYQGSKENILGGMLVKQLISIDPDDNVLVRYALTFVGRVSAKQKRRTSGIDLRRPHLVCTTLMSRLGLASPVAL